MTNDNRPRNPRTPQELLALVLTPAEKRALEATRNQILTDQVAAVVRDADGPLTSSEIGARVAYVNLEYVGDPHDFQCRGSRCTALGVVNSGDFHTHGYPGLSGSNVFRFLTRLHNKGLVTREKVDGRVLWSWFGPDLLVAAGHLDFPAPPEVDVRVEMLRESGVDVEWRDSALRGVDEAKYAGSIEFRHFGSVKTVFVELWSGAPEAALLVAVKAVPDLCRRDDLRGTRCLGEPIGEALDS